MRTNLVQQLPGSRGGGAGGFALVVTLSLMVLLTLLAVGLLSLSAISQRASGQSLARAEAEANARLALMLAFGELQELLGPDQNITAPAGIFDAEPAGTGVSGLSHRHLTGVWRARSETLERIPDYSRESSFRRWLVSNAEDTPVRQPLFFRGPEGVSRPSFPRNPFSPGLRTAL
jgi:hypothetical protein